MPAPPPMQFAPLQFASGGSGIGNQLQSLGKGLQPAIPAAQNLLGLRGPPAVDPGTAVTGAQGLTSAGGPGGPTPLTSAPGALPGTSGSASFGPPAPQQPSILDAIRGMQPQQILDVLRNMSQNGQQVIPPGYPGSAALSGAGLLPGG